MGTLQHLLPTLRASAQVLRLADFRARRRARPVAPAPRGGTRAVRITHFPERGGSSGTVSRLRISGRLVDVCAELDRLAEAEAALASRPPRRA